PQAVQHGLEGHIVRQLQVGDKAVHLQAVPVEQHELHVAGGDVNLQGQGVVQHGHGDGLSVVAADDAAVAHADALAAGTGAHQALYLGDEDVPHIPGG